MSRDIHEFLTTSCTLLALGESTHREHSIAWLRNELFAELAQDHGFASIALETDRVAGLLVDDYVRRGIGDLDTVMCAGFSHGFGEFPANRQLVIRMREHNEKLPPHRRLAFHGFDAPLETMSAPSPRRYLEYAREYLGYDVDPVELLGDDEQWSRTEAVLNPSASVGACPEAHRLRAIADDMCVELQLRAPELIAATSRDEWHSARTHLTAAVHLLRYHAKCARQVEEGDRLTGMCATRDASMADNLADIRSIEAAGGATLVFAHNAHLQRNPSTMSMGGETIEWSSAGAIFSALHGDAYRLIIGSLGRSAAIDLGDPAPDTFEGLLQSRTATWELTAADTVPAGRTRTDTVPMQGCFPLDQRTLDCADAVLHVADGDAVTASLRAD